MATAAFSEDGINDGWNAYSNLIEPLSRGECVNVHAKHGAILVMEGRLDGELLRTALALGIEANLARQLNARGSVRESELEECFCVNWAVACGAKQVNYKGLCV